MRDQDALLIMANLLAWVYNQVTGDFNPNLGAVLEEEIDERLDVIRQYATEPIVEEQNNDA